MNKLYFKSEIFDLFENARILFNNYYNGKEDYTSEDLAEIVKIISKIKDINCKEILDLINEEI